MHDDQKHFASSTQLLRPGRHLPAGVRNPGVMILRMRDMIQLQIQSRKCRRDDLANAMAVFLGREDRLAPGEGARRQDLVIYATGPRDYWVMADGSTSTLVAELTEAVADKASIFDHSAGRLVIRLCGENAVDVLAKGIALDLQHPARPSIGGALTELAQFPSLVTWRDAPPCYEIAVPHSYAASFVRWLCGVAREYGYVID